MIIYGICTLFSFSVQIHEITPAPSYLPSSNPPSLTHETPKFTITNKFIFEKKKFHVH